MKKYKVEVTCGAYTAPSLYVEASSEKEAIAQSKQKSGLGRFSNLAFLPVELK